MPSLALFQPEIAGNVGAIIRLCACLNMPLHIIEPCGFPWVERKVRQSAMDYFDHVNLNRHDDWAQYRTQTTERRSVLITTKTDQSYTDFKFKPDDIIVAGTESKGVPDYIHQHVDERITIRMHGVMRSLNLATACAMVMGEALRQTQT